MDKTKFSIFSPDEQAFALSLLDPFHDTPYRLTGAPSDQFCQSVVLTVNQELVVSSADFGVTPDPGAKWDLHVSALPILRQTNAYPMARTNTNRYECPAGASESYFQMLYPICASANYAGFPTFNSGTTTVGISTDLPYFNSNNAVTFKDPRAMRVIGVSFEVVDETPQLYKQGSVTVYTRNSCHTNPALVDVGFIPNGSTTYTTRSVNMSTFSAPPNRIQQATIIPDSKTWMASEGAYVVSKPTTLAPPFFRPGITNLAMIGSTDPIVGTLQNSYFSREGLNSVVSPSTTGFNDDVSWILPFNTSGAYFSGLNCEFGVFRIRSKINYEIIPDPTDTALISQATPTLVRNPEFETLLSRTLSVMPAGWPQSENPHGGVWRKVAKAIGSTAGIVGAVTSTLGAPEIGGPLVLLGDQLVRIGNQKGKRKPSKVKPPGGQANSAEVPVIYYQTTSNQSQKKGRKKANNKTTNP